MFCESSPAWRCRQSKTPCPGRTLSPTSPPSSAASCCSPSTSTATRSSTSSSPRRSTAGSTSTDSTSRTAPDSRPPSRCRIWSLPCTSHWPPFLEISFSPLPPDVFSHKIKHLLEPPPAYGRIQFHRLNLKNDFRLEGLIKMSHLTINLAAICTPAEYNTRPPDTIYSNFFDALPVVKYCSENNRRLVHFSTCEVLGRLLVPKDHPL